MAMNELKQTKPWTAAAMNTDVATLRALCGELNNPILTGAVTEPDPEPDFGAKASVPEKIVKEPMNMKSIVEAVKGAISQVAQMPTKIVAPEGPPGFAMPAGWDRKVFLTGAPKAGKSWLAAQMGARAFELDDPIQAMAKSAFGDYQAESYPTFAHEVFSWGEGVVSAKWPLTAARMQFVEWIREVPAKGGIDLREFGTANFWVNAMIARVARFQEDYPGELVVITDVGTAEQYQALRGAGFSTFHVTCNNITRNGRGGTPVVSSLVSSIDRDVTQKLSQEPRGGKLRCVWCDDKYPVPSMRLLSTSEFLGGVK